MNAPFQDDTPTSGREDAERALDGLGLDAVGFSRHQEFHEGCDAASEALIARIEAMMDGPVSDEHRTLIHAVVERVANKTGPQLTITQGP